jgi:hypothetical protein
MKVSRPELVLAAAVAVCLPMVPGILNGAISPMAALIRLLVALLICWAGGAVLTTMLTRYSEQARRAQILRMIERAREQVSSDASTPGQSQQLPQPQTAQQLPNS